ncbi:macrophage activating glycoprotein [Pseudohyphozyma bogoriensis]|nr:macrophage activating glycoprotein [Pseudohyphozyma bogoriensis]
MVPSSASVLFWLGVLAPSIFASPEQTLTTLPKAPGATITSAPSKVARAAEASASPLTAYHYSYGSQPYQVNPCNSTTLGSDSQCQTLIVNSIDDFCLWGSPTTSPNGTIGDDEAAVVAYCTTDKWGTRVIPPGALTGVQFMRTSAYIQVTGLISNAGLNLVTNDTGGELDPHGADLAGNPLGGLVYSNSLPTTNGTMTQAIEWNNFVGGGKFCIKVCDNTDTVNYCQNIYDLLGCDYNMPAAYADNQYLACDGDLQSVVGTYTSAGQTLTYSQGTELTGTLPWTPVVPSSSNCVTYQSSQLYSAATTTSSGAASGASATSGAGATSTGAGASQASSGSTTTSGAAATSTTSAAAGRVGASLFVVMGVAGGMLAALLA